MSSVPLWIKIVAGVISSLIVASVLGITGALNAHDIDIATLQSDYSHLKEGQIRIERKQDKILDKLDTLKIR